ncbi:GyrI-like domain-containing protein [Metabacillus malikii]|uniref:Effector-binding domain-containing protein n=1 Tax=Metabacillus malikii TaxID=1504265 RepID=A0ABT9ZEP5_9BACI|nr:GyrI-like domain-containing protein [Metabacillus malikii]MDQ0230740.1 effector-binding domain-containing protein [Metabacillus malikii]
MTIKTNQSLTIPNVVAFRKEMAEHAIQQELQSFAMYLKGKDVKKVGPTVSTTYAVRTDNQQTILDMEFLIPINREIDVNHDYRFISEFHLTNALYTSHSNPLSSIDESYQALLHYIKENSLQEISGFYTVQTNEDDVNQGATPIVDIYIAVNPNRL